MKKKNYSSKDLRKEKKTTSNVKFEVPEKLISVLKFIVFFSSFHPKQFLKNHFLLKLTNKMSLKLFSVFRL